MFRAGSLKKRKGKEEEEEEEEEEELEIAVLTRRVSIGKSLTGHTQVGHER